MKRIEILKKTGKKRVIYVPNSSEKSALRSIMSQIAKKANRACPENVVHGFVRGKSPVTNATAHIGHKYTLCFDLQDFFDTVTEKQLVGKLTTEELNKVLVDGAARQGLPTSPAVANLAAADMDKAILKWCEKSEKQFVYTRYADDLTFSYDDISLTEQLKKVIPSIVSRCGFKINIKKTHFQSSSGGRRIITGVAVDDSIHATRAVKRRLRAAIHQNNSNVVAGLTEWCKCKPPQEKETIQLYQDELQSLCKVWKLPKINLDKLPKKSADEDIGEDCIITSDPAYMLGMSTWTTGWTSCMSQPHGKYRRGVFFWIHLRGTRLAALLSNKVKVIGGVERKVMRARALVHELRNGEKVYDRLYGNPGDIDKLRNQLEKVGYKFVQDVSGEVVGHAPAIWKAWFDNMSCRISKATGGVWKGKKVRILRTKYRADS